MGNIDAQRLKTALELRLEKDIADQKLYGAALHVSQNGKVLYHGALGIADPVTNTPITDKTIFRLASMTKPITAVAVLLLRDRGLLDLDDPVEKYLPAFSGLQVAVLDGEDKVVSTVPATKKPTIRMLLCHTSGIGCGKLGGVQMSKMTEADKATIENTVDYFSRQLLSFEPGTKQAYSGLPAFDALTAIIEKVSQEKLGDFIKREILDKCDMPDTTFEPSAAQWERLAVMHTRTDEKSGWKQMPEGTIFDGIPCTHHLGGAGLVSTLSDYAHFASMLLDEGVYAGKRIVAEASIQELHTPQVTPEVHPGLCRWGLGVRLVADDRYPCLPVGAYGWSGHYGPHFWIDPVNRITAVYLKNSFYDPGAGSVTGYNFEEDVYASMQ